MKVSQSCSWCHQINQLTITLGGIMASFCSNCGHRADKSRLECDCPSCSGRDLVSLARSVNPDGIQGGPLDRWGRPKRDG